MHNDNTRLKRRRLVGTVKTKQKGERNRKTKRDECSNGTIREKIGREGKISHTRNNAEGETDRQTGTTRACRQTVAVIWSRHC